MRGKRSFTEIRVRARLQDLQELRIIQQRIHCETGRSLLLGAFLARKALHLSRVPPISMHPCATIVPCTDAIQF